MQHACRALLCAEISATPVCVTLPLSSPGYLLADGKSSLFSAVQSCAPL